MKGYRLIIKYIMHKKNAQVFSIDLIIALSIFLIAGAIVVVALYEFNNDADEKNKFNNMYITAVKASDILVKSEGLPKDWNSSNLTVIGLAESDRVISPSKVNRMINLSYNVTRRNLGLYPYEFYIALKNITGSKIIEYGNNFTDEAGAIRVISSRRVVYNGEAAIFDLQVWDK